MSGREAHKSQSYTQAQLKSLLLHEVCRKEEASTWHPCRR
uniref:Translational machinery associated 7 n=1 Tax=Mus musculus TaxID=10090 RepID=A0A0A6YXZ5_MOUSE